MRSSAWIVLCVLLSAPTAAQAADEPLPPPRIMEHSEPQVEPPPSAGQMDGGQVGTRAVSAPDTIADWVPSNVGLPALPAAAASARFVRNPSQRWHISRATYRPRGPVEKRDEWILAAPHLTLPAFSPDPLPKGEWRVHFHVDRGNDFGFDQFGPAENPIDRRFLVDGEHQTTELGARYGLFPRLSVGIRVPVHWRGGGFMDSIIDWFHEAGSGIGFLDNGRPAFRKDLYRMEGRDTAFNAISWNDKRGTGLGNIELDAMWNFVQPCCRSDWRAALVTRVALPTGTDPYDTDSVDVGVQVAVAKQVGRRWDLYAGLGGTWFSETELDGIEYEELRWHFFAAIEYHLSRRISLVVETDWAPRLVTNLANYPATTGYLNLSGRWDITRCLEMEIGLTEHLEDQQGTVDFAAFLGFTLRL